MLGWRDIQTGEACEQLTLDLEAPDCGDNPPAEPAVDDDLSFDEWMRSLPRTP